LNPANDGKIIRVPMRNIRREANEHLKKLMKDKAISEDQERKALDEVQEMTDGYLGKFDGTSMAKEKDILDVK
jgi:ribosome recycling factor